MSAPVPSLHAHGEADLINAIVAAHAKCESGWHNSHLSLPLTTLVSAIWDIVNMVESIELSGGHKEAMISCYHSTYKLVKAIVSDCQIIENRETMWTGDSPVLEILGDREKSEQALLGEIVNWNLFQAGLILDAMSEINLADSNLAELYSNARQNAIKAPDLSDESLDESRDETPSTQLASLSLRTQTGETSPQNPLIERWLRQANSLGEVTTTCYFAYSVSCGNVNTDRFARGSVTFRVEGNQVLGSGSDLWGQSTILGELGADGTSIMFRKQYISPPHQAWVVWEYVGCLTPCGILGEWRNPDDPLEDCQWRGIFGIWMPGFESAFFEDQYRELNEHGTLMYLASPRN